MSRPDTTPDHSHDQRNLQRRALRGIGWVAIEKWGVRLVSMAVFVVLLRTIDADAFGLVSFTTSVASVLLVFVDAGFSKSLIQKKTLNDDDAHTAFWTSLGIATVIYVGVYFAAPSIERLVGLPGLTPIMQVLGLMLFASALSSVPAALLERDMKFRALGVRNLFGTIVGAVLSVPMAFIGLGAWALVAQSLGTVTAATVALWVTSPWKPKFRFSRASLRRMASFGLSVMGIDLTNALQSNIDKVLVNALLGAEAGGIYYVAQRAVKLITDLITSVIGKVALTTFSKVQDDSERLNRGFLQLTLATCLVAFPIFAVAAALADVILPFVAGTDASWSEAVPLMQVFAVAAAFTAVAYYDKQTLLAVGHPRRAFTLGLIENFVGIALFVAAAPFGLFALALSRASRLFIMWPYRLWLLHRYAKIRIKPYMVNVGTTALAAVITVGGALLLSLTQWRQAEPEFAAYGLPVGILMFVVYAVLAWVLVGARNRVVLMNTFKNLRR